MADEISRLAHADWQDIDPVPGLVRSPENCSLRAPASHGGASKPTRGVKRHGPVCPLCSESDQIDA
jgi:hypothetical protein